MDYFFKDKDNDNDEYFLNQLNITFKYHRIIYEFLNSFKSNRISNYQKENLKNSLVEVKNMREKISTFRIKIPYLFKYNLGNIELALNECISLLNMQYDEEIVNEKILDINQILNFSLVQLNKSVKKLGKLEYSRNLKDFRYSDNIDENLKNLIRLQNMASGKSIIRFKTKQKLKKKQKTKQKTKHKAKHRQKKTHKV